MTPDRFELRELVAVSWSDEMTQRFPNADHTGCRQLMHPGPDGHWVPHRPPHCLDWHCNRCGAPTNSYGHHDCPDRPERQENRL